MCTFVGLETGNAAFNSNPAKRYFLTLADLDGRGLRCAKHLHQDDGSRPPRSIKVKARGLPPFRPLSAILITYRKLPSILLARTPTATHGLVRCLLNLGIDNLEILDGDL